MRLRERLQLQQLLDRLREVGKPNRLAQAFVGTSGKTLLAMLLSGRGRYGNDWQVRKLWILPQQRRGLQP